MMTYPDLRPSTTGHWPPRIADVPRGVPILGEHMLGAKGKGLVMGWTPLPPADWKPQDLIWQPSAKSLDLAGAVVEVQTIDGSAHAWVVSQLVRRDRYLEMLRQKVLSGSIRLTAALAKVLGLPADGALLREPQPSEAQQLSREFWRSYAMTGRN